MCKGPTRSEALERAWRERIAQQQQSGLTARDFCQNENLKESAFYYWRRELARRDGQSCPAPAKHAGRKPANQSPSPFLPIAVAPTGAVPIEIALPGGVSVRVTSGCEESLLKMVVDALQEA